MHGSMNVKFRNMYLGYLEYVHHFYSGCEHGCTTADWP